MTEVNPSERHLQRAGLEEYLRAGAPAVVVIEGSPEAQLAISPFEGQLTLRVRSDVADPPDVHGYRHFSANTTTIAGERWLEVTITGHDSLLDAYPVLCSVADRVQQDAVPFATAVLDALASYRQILQGLRKLGDDQELGLYGELLVVEHLAEVIDFAHAVRAWRGPSREEHDFGLESDDLEIKSTISETRQHWVQGLHQLEPTAGRPLWLVSIQLTTAGDGGRTLPMLITDLRGRIADQHTRREFEDRLAVAGWTDEQHDAFNRLLRPRTTPAAFAVDASFPAMTSATLTNSGLPVERFRQVHYQLDLSGLVPSESPPVEIRRLTSGQDS